MTVPELVELSAPKWQGVSECNSGRGTLQMTILELAELITQIAHCAQSAVPVQDPTYDHTGTGKAQCREWHQLY
jgi:hypothetical protein